MSLDIVSCLQRAVDLLPAHPFETTNPDYGQILSLAKELVKKLESPKDLIRRIGYEVSPI